MTLTIAILGAVTLLALGWIGVVWEVVLGGI